MAINAPFVYNAHIESLAGKARTATDLKTLETVCEDLNVADEIYLGKVDLWLAKIALSAVYRTLKKFPAIRSRLNYFGTLNGFIEKKDTTFMAVNPTASKMHLEYFRQGTLEIARNCLNSFRANGIGLAFAVGVPPFYMNGIIINGKSLHKQEIMQNLEIGERVGHSPKGCNSVKSVIDHEIGHLLDYALDLSNNRGLQKYINGFSVDEMGKNLSLYSTTGGVISVPEVIAEAYSEYSNNPSPRPIAKAIGEFITARYNDRFN
ncbi:MAG: hypothetical protein IJY84_01775 [Clostridia bacterium]|nr:hypothetical protein [Clostridia bacterium]